MTSSGNHLISRFIRQGDARSDRFVFPLHASWWSRPYEYDWAGRFAEEGDVALDAACGLCHPLKFHLLERCREVHACDFDPRILSHAEILKDIAESFGTTTAEGLPERYLTQVRYACASVTALPSRDGMFDKIYCISTLEHLRDTFNRHAGLRFARRFLPLRRDIRDSLAEFRRVLSPGGKVVLTFDHPDINLDYFQEVSEEVGLAFAGDAEFSRPADAIHSRELGLSCFRAVLTRPPGGRV